MAENRHSQYEGTSQYTIKAIILYHIIPCIFVAVSCYDAGNLTHGYQSKQNFSSSQTIHYWCDLGYNLTGSENRTCTEFGTWSGTRPFCVREYLSIYFTFSFT